MRVAAGFEVAVAVAVAGGEKAVFGPMLEDMVLVLWGGGAVVVPAQAVFVAEGATVAVDAVAVLAVAGAVACQTIEVALPLVVAAAVGGEVDEDIAAA